jgi:hypothetical protein
MGILKPPTQVSEAGLNTEQFSTNEKEFRGFSGRQPEKFDAEERKEMN